MIKLNEMSKDLEGTVVSVSGDQRFVSRITSIGLTPGCNLTMIKNSCDYWYVPDKSKFARNYKGKIV